MQASGARTPDPPWTGRFIFRIDGVEIGTFTEVSGLSVSLEVEELAEGGQNQFTHTLPGRMKWPNLVLKRGLTNNRNLFAWMSACSGDGFTRRNNRLGTHEGEISIRDGKGAVVQSWDFTEAYPVKWTGPQLAASSRDLAVEELEVAHHGFTIGKIR